MNVNAEIEDIDPREEIARLEVNIEELTAKIESCRKFIMLSWIAIVLGIVLLLPGIAGRGLSEPIILIGAIVAVLGGIVMAGSNSSTKREAAEQLAAIEDRRATLISQLDLRVVNDRELASTRQ